MLPGRGTDGAPPDGWYAVRVASSSPPPSMSASGRPITLLLALGFGFAGGATAVAVLTPSARHSPVEAREASPGDLDASREDLRRLDARVAGLERRLEAVELLPKATGRVPAGETVSPTDLEALRADVLAAGGASAGPAATPEELRASVAEALEVLADGEAAASALDPEGESLSLDQRVRILREHLELSDAQSEAVREALLEKSNREAQALASWARGETAGTLRDARRSIQAELRSAIERALYAPQIERLRAVWPADEADEGF